jgi:hypothetical protein
MIVSCYNCRHWKSIYPEKQKAKKTVLWDFCEPDWEEKDCEISNISGRWLDREAIGTLVTKHQAGNVDEVKNAIAAQCPEYKTFI